MRKGRLRGQEAGGRLRGGTARFSNALLLLGGAAAAARATPRGALCCRCDARWSRAPCPLARRQQQRRRFQVARRTAPQAPPCMPQLLQFSRLAAPPLPAPCGRRTRAGTCPPRPRAIAGSCISSAAPRRRRRPVPLSALPVETAVAFLTVLALPGCGHAPSLTPTSRYGPASSTFTLGCGLARTSERGPAPGPVLTSRRF